MTDAILQMLTIIGAAVTAAVGLYLKIRADRRLDRKEDRAAEIEDREATRKEGDKIIAVWKELVAMYSDKIIELERRLAKLEYSLIEKDRYIWQLEIALADAGIKPPARNYSPEGVKP